MARDAARGRGENAVARGVASIEARRLRDEWKKNDSRGTVLPRRRPSPSHSDTTRARRAGVSIRAGGAVAMVPRHLRATDPGQKHVLPSTHQPSAAGTVAPVAPAEQPAREVTTTKRKPPRGASRGERSGRGFAPPPIPRDVADDARCPQMDHVGAWGRVPNLHWCAPHDDQLRRHPRFRALPRGAPRARVGGVLSIRATGHRAVGRSAPRTTHHRVPDWRARVPGGGRSQGAGDGRALGQSRTTRGAYHRLRQPPPSLRPRRANPRAGRGGERGGRSRIQRKPPVPGRARRRFRFRARRRRRARLRVRRGDEKTSPERQG